MRQVGYKKRKNRYWAACLAAVVLMLAWMTFARGAVVRINADCFPLDTEQWRVTDAYGWRQDPFTGKSRFHTGVDLACAEGTEVLAVESGVILSAKRSKSYGNYIKVWHLDGNESLYAHLQYLYVRAGETVSAGQCLGTVGQTGNATGPHLHFERRIQGQCCDPVHYLGL